MADDRHDAERETWERFLRNEDADMMNGLVNVEVADKVERSASFLSSVRRHLFPARIGAPGSD